MSKAAELAEFGGGISSGPNAVEGLAKAWVYSVVSGGTPGLTDSLNVSSVTDVGVGDYKFNFTSAMNNLTFAVMVTTQYTNTTGTGAFFNQEDSSDKTTTSSGMDHFQNATKVDPILATSTVHGELA
jgi:hypothetical protein